MRVLAAAVLLFAAASAAPEAPSSQYGAPSGSGSAPGASASGPYPPSGWRPAGRQFVLPSRQSAAYAPPQQYGPPPPQPTTEAAEPTTTEQPTTTAAVPAVVPAGSRSAAQREPLETNDAGVYYVLLPDGRLQRVSYAHGPAPAMFSLLPGPERLTQGSDSGAAVADAGYLARIHYQNLLPVGAPVYSYAAPELVRVF